MWVLACLGYWFRPFWGTNPQKTGDRGKSPWIQSGPKKWGLEIQWPQKFRKEWCWLPQIDPAGDFRNMIWWPVRRGLTFLEMVTWNKVRFCTEIRGFPNFFELLDLFRHVGTANIVCVCVFIPRMAICGLELFPWGHTSVLTSLRHQTRHPWSCS